MVRNDILKVWPIILVPGAVIGIMSSVVPLVALNVIDRKEPDYVNSKLSQVHLI
jgi:hypothetical protein